MEKSPLTKKTNITQNTNKNSKKQNTINNSITNNDLPKHIPNHSQSKKLNKCLNLLHINAADMNNKAEDLKNKIEYFKSSIVSIQETHYRKKGKFMYDNFHVFEAIRKNKEKGGLC